MNQNVKFILACMIMVLGVIAAVPISQFPDPWAAWIGLLDTIVICCAAWVVADWFVEAGVFRDDR